MIFGGFCYRMQEWISSAHWKCLFLLLTNEDNGMGMKTFFVAQRPKRGQKPWKSFAFITSFHWCSKCQLISHNWFHNFSLVVGSNMFQPCNGADAWKPSFCSLNKAAIKCYNYTTLVLWLSDYCPIALLVNKKWKTTCSLGKTSQRCIFLPVPLVYLSYLSITRGVPVEYHMMWLDSTWVLQLTKRPRSIAKTDGFLTVEALLQIDWFDSLRPHKLVRWVFFPTSSIYDSKKKVLSQSSLDDDSLALPGHNP